MLWLEKSVVHLFELERTKRALFGGFSSYANTDNKDEKENKTSRHEKTSRNGGERVEIFFSLRPFLFSFVVVGGSFGAHSAGERDIAEK